MSHVSRPYRASGSWDDLTPPRLESAERRTPPLVPWGLGGDESVVEQPKIDGKELYLCVLCWEWHTGPGCAPPTSAAPSRAERRVDGTPRTCDRPPRGR